MSAPTTRTTYPLPRLSVPALDEGAARPSLLHHFPASHYHRASRRRSRDPSTASEKLGQFAPAKQSSRRKNHPGEKGPARCDALMLNTAEEAVGEKGRAKGSNARLAQAPLRLHDEKRKRKRVKEKWIRFTLWVRMAWINLVRKVRN